MPGCRNTDGLFQSGLCMGLISGLAVNGGSCPPRGVPDGQKRLVIVAYIDARPSRLHEDFRILALEAMKAAWPCKR
ncbi:Rap1a/Tai family immunity protein [Tardiphaga sp. vice278]|uniref:Rap1a/Tai family immunity protein n=1 Tax=Tardiphaga sp. vice278 TaxID=2592815 RepID=UPI0034A05E9D